MVIDEVVQQALETARGMWRRRWIGMVVAWALGVLGAVALTLMPNRYEASARVYVDTKTVLRPLMRDLTVEPDLDQTVGLLARTLITRPNVELLMRRSGLETGLSTQLERDRMAETLMRDIKVAASGRDNVFNFSYRDTQPDRARVVVQNLVSLFLESDTGAKRRDAESAREFIDEQIKNYEARLAEAENRLKEFKLRNLGLTEAYLQADGAPGAYTFWDYQAGAWQRNNGIRIDHALLSPQAADKLAGVAIHKHVRGWDKPSDHVPLVVELDI